MTESIEKVTLENAAEQLKAKIRMAFVELIPDEQWKEMVTSELKKFLQVQSIPPASSWGDTKFVPSEFTKICDQVFREYIRTEIQTMLGSPEWRETWTHNGRHMLSDAIKSWCTENSQKLIESTVQARAGQAAQALIGLMQTR